LKNIFQVVLQGNTMTNTPVAANEAPKTPDQVAPAKPAEQQNQGSEPSKPSEQQK
jgi:hypothetical protein